MFSTIFTFLIVALAAYYIGMIAYDIYKGKLEEASEADKREETEIDISEEVDNFSTTDVMKDKPDYSPYEPQEYPEEVILPGEEDLSEPLMTDGIEIGELLKEVDKLARKGNSDLGDIIYQCTEAA